MEASLNCLTRHLLNISRDSYVFFIKSVSSMNEPSSLIRSWKKCLSRLMNSLWKEEDLSIIWKVCPHFGFYFLQNSEIIFSNDSTGLSHSILSSPSTPHIFRTRVRMLLSTLEGSSWNTASSI
jgi:hypothetical protein